jgi:hypothetical protein
MSTSSLPVRGSGTITRAHVNSFSDSTIKRLRAAVVVQLQNPDAPSSELVKHVEQLGKEAREQNIPPEHLIVTFKQLWNDVAESLRPQRADQYERLKQGLVTQCIRAYYAE